MIFCHHAGATAIDGLEHATLANLNLLIRLNEDIVNILPHGQPSKVVGIALVTIGMSDEQALAAIKQTEEQTGLPATDIWRFGPGKLMDALVDHFAA